MATGLNTTTSKNRLRFVSLSQRLQQVNVDVVHRVHASGSLDASLSVQPDSGKLGCYFQDELEVCKQNDHGTDFRRFYHEIWPFVQSLPELLHHQNKVVDILERQLRSVEPIHLPSFLQLVAVMSKDLQDELYPNFQRLFTVILGRINDVVNCSSSSNAKSHSDEGEEGGGSKGAQPNIDVTVKTFECLSYLIKDCLPRLMEEPDVLRKHYGQMLGHSVSYVRDFSAKTLIILFRKLSRKSFSSHFKKIARAVCVNVKKTLDVFDPEDIAPLFEVKPIKLNGDFDGRDSKITAIPKVVNDIIDGLTLSVFYTCKGVKDCLHSQTEARLQVLWEHLAPCKQELLEEALQQSEGASTSYEAFPAQLREKVSAVTGDAAVSVFVYGRLLSVCIPKLFRHAKPANFLVLWGFILNATKELTLWWRLFSKASCVPQPFLAYMDQLSQYILELMVFALCHSNGRGLSNHAVKQAVGETIIDTSFAFLAPFLGEDSIIASNRVSSALSLKAGTLMCKLWAQFPENKALLRNVDALLPFVLRIAQPHPMVNLIAHHLLGKLPDAVIKKHLLRPILSQMTAPHGGYTPMNWLSLLLKLLSSIKDFRDYDTHKSRHSKDDADASEVGGSSNADRKSLTALLLVVEDEIISIANKVLVILSGLLVVGDTSMPPVADDSRAMGVVAVRCLLWMQCIYPSCLSHKSNASIYRSIIAAVLSHHKSALTLLTGIAKLGRVLFAYTTKVLCLQDAENLAGHFSGMIKGYVTVIASSPESVSLSWAMHSLLVCSANASKDTSFDIGHVLDAGEIRSFLSTAGRALMTPSHWLRIHLLRILTFFPLAIVQNQDNSKKLKDETTQFDAVGLCLEAASLPVTLDNERPFARILGNLEVAVRGARLPEEYECIVTAFCMGMLSVKFKPFWEPCVLVIIASVAHETGEGIVWPQLIRAIEYWSTFSDDRVDEWSDGDCDDDDDNYERVNSHTSYSSYLTQLKDCDDGLRPFGVAAVDSLMFYHRPADKAVGNVVVLADSRTDCETAYASTWDILKRCPNITLKRSRHVIPLFLRFLKHQYYEAFSDDAEVPFLHRIGLFDSIETSEEDATPSLRSNLSHKVLHSRLVMFLAVLSAVTAPKQLYQHQLLFKYFNAVLSKPDPSIASLALECIFHYKPPYAVPHNDTLKRLLDDKTFRDELVVFDPAEGGAIDPKSRESFLPMLTKVLYGRFVSRAKKSKAARDKGVSRRIAVLSFLSRLQPDELVYFVHLMLRGLVSKDKLMALAKCPLPAATAAKVSGQPYHEDLQEELRQWCADTSGLILALTPYDMGAIYPERLTGFLFLLEHVVKVLGYGATTYVHMLFQLVGTILLYANQGRAQQKLCLQAELESEQDLMKKIESGEEEPEVDEDAHRIDGNKRQDFLRLRTMALLRLVDLVNQYHGVFDFQRWTGSMFESVSELVDALPSSMSGSKHPPALLKLINAFAQYDETSVIVCRDQHIIVSLIRCIAERSDVVVSKIIVETINILISYDSGNAIIPHANLIISCFCERFTGTAFDGSTELKISELNINPSTVLKQELKLLCRIAEEFFSKAETSITSTYVFNLATLLLGMLRAYTHSRLIRAEEEWVIDILRIYKALVWRMHDVRSHVAFISRLFGPATHSQSLFNFISVRKCLVSVYAEMSKHPSSKGQLKNSLKALEEATAQDPNFLDNRDFDRAMSVFQSLSGETKGGKVAAMYTWTNLLGPGVSESPTEASVLTVMVHECLRCMYDSELVVRSAALACLKSLVNETIVWSGLLVDSRELVWLEVLTSLVIPGIRRGLKQSSDTTKRGFILLLGHVVNTVGRCSEGHGNPEGFHSDLAVLWHEDPEQNFFENICHIQIHRRVRALAKLRGLLEDLFAQSGDDKASFSTSSLVHVLSPLAQHPLFSEEFVKKDHLTYMQEAAAFVGAVALHLPWSHYFTSIKTLLKQLDRDRKEREKVLISALCSVLDSFHFGVRSDNSAVSVQSGIAELFQKPETGDADDVEDTDIVKGPIDNAPDAGADPAAKIYNIVITTLMPWVRVFLLKDGLDHKGNKTKSVRTPIAVALAKLLKKIEAALSEDKKKELFSNLLISVVGTLKSRDTSARDTARESLLKILQTMGIGSLQPVLYELKHSLKEGYQRHVGSYSVRSLLSTFLQKYAAAADAPSASIVSGDRDIDFEVPFPDFDKCIPLITEFVLDDLTGTTHEDREVEGATRTVIREAKGSKANDILEVTSRCLLFRPSYALKCLSNPSSVSSIHALTTPMLSALTDCESPETIGRISEALQRVAIGLSLNASVSAAELMLYMHATLEPFVALIVKENTNRKKALGRIVRNNHEEEAEEAEEDKDDEIEDELPSYLKEDSSDEEEALYSVKKTKGDNVTGYSASTWLPSERVGTNDRKAAIEAQKQERAERTRVQDGVSAPKMTGFNRYKRGKAGGKAGAADLNPAAVAAVKFCLTLFNAALRQSRLDGSDPEIRAMAMPFLPLLGHCLKFHGATGIVAWSMRCLCILLTWKLPTDPQFSRAVGSRILKLMFKGGALLSMDTDLVQACLKGLHSLFQMYNDNVAEATESEVAEKKPLSDDKLRLLIQLLTVSIMEITSGYQNAAFQLIRSIIDTKILVPEIYNLVTVLMEQIVLSQRAGIRESSSTTIVSFILNYPLGEKRLENHMKQLVANCSYEYEEGRLSAFDTVSSLVKLLPLPILEDYSHVLFMPMAMRLVNDISSKCREAAAQIITILARRMSAERVDSLMTYGIAWLKSDLAKGPETRPLVRTGAQVVGILLVARPDVFKHSGHAPKVVSHVANVLSIITNLAEEFRQAKESASSDIVDVKEGEGGGGGAETWAITYHLLLLLEQLYKALPTLADKAISQCSQGGDGKHIMYAIQECMLFPHSWVRGVACRVLTAYLELRDASSIAASTASRVEVLGDKNALYQIARRLCVVLNQPTLADSLVHSVTYGLSFVVLAMHYHPHLCEKVVNEPGSGILAINDDDEVEPKTKDDDDENMNVDSDEDLDVGRPEAAATGAEVASSESPGGVSWVMNRLRWLGANNRGSRRLYVIKVLKSLIILSPVVLVEENMDKIIEVPIRVQLTTTGPDEVALKELKEQSLDLLNAIEVKIGSSSFIGAYSEVQRRLQHTRQETKRKIAVEAIIAPAAHSARKIQKTLDKRNAKKRKDMKRANPAITGLSNSNKKRKVA